MNLRDGLGVNTSKKMRTNSKTKKEKTREKKEKKVIPQTKQPASGQPAVTSYA